LLTSTPPGGEDVWGMNCSTPALSHRGVGTWSSPSASKGRTRWDESPSLVLEARREAPYPHPLLGAPTVCPVSVSSWVVAVELIHLHRPLRRAFPHVIGEGPQRLLGQAHGLAHLLLGRGTRRPVLLCKGIVGDATVIVSDSPSSTSSSSSVSETSLPQSCLACLSHFLFFLSSFAFFCALFKARFAALVASLLSSGARWSMSVRSLD
jgi:hypothetical protein